MNFLFSGMFLSCGIIFFKAFAMKCEAAALRDQPHLVSLIGTSAFESNLVNIGTCYGNIEFTWTTWTTSKIHIQNFADRTKPPNFVCKESKFNLTIIFGSSVNNTKEYKMIWYYYSFRHLNNNTSILLTPVPNNFDLIWQILIYRFLNIDLNIYSY